MVKNKGFLPSAPSEIPIQRKQLKEIIFSLLPACKYPDMDSGIPFKADAIITNPPAYGHTHGAESTNKHFFHNAMDQAHQGISASSFSCQTTCWMSGKNCLSEELILTCILIIVMFKIILRFMCTSCIKSGVEHITL